MKNHFYRRADHRLPDKGPALDKGPEVIKSP